MRNFRVLSGQALAVAASLALLVACGGGDDDNGILPDDSTTTTTLGTTTTTTGSTTTTTLAGETANRAEQFMSEVSFRCIGEGADNAAVQTTCFNNVATQSWKTTRVGDAYTLTNNESNLCLGIADGATTNEALAVTMSCDGSPQTLWTFEALGTGDDANRIRMIAQHSGKCLEVGGSDATEGKQLSQYTCGVNTQANQTWVRTVLAE